MQQSMSHHSPSLSQQSKPRSAPPHPGPFPTAKLQLASIPGNTKQKYDACLPLHGSQDRQLVQQDIVEILSDPEDVVFSHGVEVVTLPTLLLAHEVVHGQPHLCLFACVEGEVGLGEYELLSRGKVGGGEGVLRALKNNFGLP